MIRPITDDDIQAIASEAAEQGIPLEEAHAHLKHESLLREQFDAAYHAALQSEVA